MIYARFTHPLTNVTTKAVTQWDYGRKLRIEGLDLPTAVRVDFGISGEDTTISRIGVTKDNVTDVVIPDSLLEQSKPLVAYVYINDTTEGKTVRTINIPVTARAKPEEFDTPEGKELFAEAIELVNDAADRVATAEESANLHADSAKESFEATKQIAEAFTGTAETAVKSVNDTGAAQIQAINKKGTEVISEVNTTGEARLQSVVKAGTDAVLDIEAAKGEALSAVNAKGAEQLQAIEETTAQIVSDRNQIDENTRNKAGAIVLNAEGESIIVADASDCYLQGLKVFGKSTQDGTPTPDAPVEIVNIVNPIITVDEQSISIPRTLPGIPVSSGGNYTDENGQQWICDEVDLARGVYVQRIGKSELIGTEYFEDFVAEYNTVTLAIAHKDNTEIICSHSYLNSAVMWANSSRIKFEINKFGVSTFSDFKTLITNNYTNGNPVTILYVIPTPIETPLSDAEINAFMALHTNKPNTTVLNDSGAYMAVEYVADTKAYIDNKLAELTKGSETT